MQKRNGFTLIELVVVVMILGILAAVAAPKLLSTSGTATDNGLQQTLGVVRDVIERYAAENGGQLPGDGGTEADFKADIADYLRGAFPICPVGPAQNSDVTVSTAGTALAGDAAADTDTGWRYDNKSGEFIVNYAGALTSDSSTNYDDL